MEEVYLQEFISKRINYIPKLESILIGQDNIAQVGRKVEIYKEEFSNKSVRRYTLGMINNYYIN